MFARPDAVHNAQVLARSQQLAAQLGEALTSRAVIDQALGIIMSRTGADADEAFNRLRTMSQSQHQKVAELARTWWRRRYGGPAPGNRTTILTPRQPGQIG